MVRSGLGSRLGLVVGLELRLGLVLEYFIDTAVMLGPLFCNSRKISTFSVNLATHTCLYCLTVMSFFPSQHYVFMPNNLDANSKYYFICPVTYLFV